jgi:hypothetical protein
MNEWSMYDAQRTGIAEVGELEFRLPVTDAKFINNF